MPSTNKNYGSSWGKKVLFEDFECPSGEWCQVRVPAPRQLISLGLLDKFDQLSSLIDEKHIKRVKGKDVVDVASLGQDPKSIMDVMAMADRIVEYAVVQPDVRRPVKPNPNPRAGSPDEIPLTAEEREDGVIYTDMIEENDRMYIFMHQVGGSMDLATFRKQIDQSDGSVGNVVEVVRPAKRAPRNGPRS